MPADLIGDFHDHEFVGPRREATLAAERRQLPQDGKDGKGGVGGRLMRDVVLLDAGDRSVATVRLVPGDTQEQLVQSHDRLVADSGGGAK